MLQWLAILVLCIVAAVAYGVVHDQFTARLCIEYFTIGHPPIFGDTVNSPTIIGMAWGVIATWWVGLGLGIALATAARFGSRPKRNVGTLILPIGKLMLFTGAMAVVFGVLGYVAAICGWIELYGELAQRVPESKHVLFLTDLWAHSASYFFATVGGIVLIIHTWRTRSPHAAATSNDTNNSPVGSGTAVTQPAGGD